MQLPSLALAQDQPGVVHTTSAGSIGQDPSLSHDWALPEQGNYVHLYIVNLFRFNSNPDAQMGSPDQGNYVRLIYCEFI